MPWTESRSRDEWLAEVKRRGERIRRRRRFTLACVAAFALVMPLSAAAGFLTSLPDRGVELSAAGPAPAGGMAPTPEVPASPTDAAGPTAPVESAVPVENGPAASSPTTTAEVHGRTAVIDGEPGPRTAASVPPADDPVVRSSSTTTTRPSSTNGLATASSAGAGSAALRSNDQQESCTAADVRVGVITNRPVYALGEKVSAALIVERNPASTCLLERVGPDGTVYTRAAFRVEDATGRVVARAQISTESLSPDRRELQTTYAEGFEWDQQDCGGDAGVRQCLQVPAGTYTVVGEWSEIGPFTARSTIRVGA